MYLQNYIETLYLLYITFRTKEEELQNYLSGSYMRHGVRQ